MKRQDFRYNAKAEALGAIPTGTRVGQFLFLSAQPPINMDTGKIIRDLVDLPPDVRDKLATPGAPALSAYFGPAMAQTWMIYHNLAEILALQGASLKDTIRQRIFLRDIRDVGWVERTMLSFFPEEKPTTLIMGVASRGLHRDIRVWADLVALAPQEGGLKKEAIHLPELQQVTGPYPSGVKVGQYLFFEGMTGIDPRSGAPVTKLSDVDSEARSSYHGLHIDTASEAMKAQLWLIFNGHFRRLVESQGGTLDNLLDVTGYWRGGVRDAVEREYLREKLFKTAETSPPSTGFGVRNLSINPHIETLWGGIALLPGQYQKQPLRYGDTERTGLYASLTKAGLFWFHAGMIGTDLREQQHIESFADLGDGGRLLAQNYIDDNDTIMAKAWYIYNFELDNIETRPDQVVHQTVYLVNASAWPAVERIANIVFKGHLPPTTIVPVDEVAFYWRYHMPHAKLDADILEIQLWGYKS